MIKKIPKSVRLPGFKAKIVQLDHDEFIEDFGRSKAHWVDEEMTIYLDRSRPIRKRRADLLHEIGHFYLDWQVMCLGQRNVDSKG